MSVGATTEKGPVLFRLSVKQYHAMIKGGILTEDDSIELLEGMLVKKMAHNPPHDFALTRLNRFFVRLLGDEWVVRVKCPVTLTTSEPEPDFVVASGPDAKYGQRHPTPKDVAILAEVSDSSLEVDRVRKGRIYARAGIPEYWIVNVAERIVEVYTDPQGGRKPCYATRTDYSTSDRVPFDVGEDATGELPVGSLFAKENDESSRR